MGDVLSDAGIDEFARWFVSDDFERDMCAYQTFIQNGDKRTDPEREMMGMKNLSKLPIKC